MRCLRPRLVRLTAVLALLAGPTRVGAEPGWTEVPLAGGRAGLLPRIGLAADVPRALALGEIVRVAHASRDPDTAIAQTLRDYFAAPPSGTESLPVPLGLAEWRPILGNDLSADLFIRRLLADRRAALLAYGLLQLDPETRTFIGADLTLMRRLYERSGIVAGFAQALQIRDGALVLPGGDAARSAWTALLGDAVADPSRAILRLVEEDNGRLLYFLETVTRLDASRQQLVLSDRPDNTAGDRLQSIYRTFTRVEPGWRFGDFPFVRLGADPALVLAAMQPANGELRHTRAFWEVVLDDRTLVKNHRKRWANLDADDRVEPAWVLNRITDAALPQRLEAMELYAFAERTTSHLTTAPVSDVAFLSRGFRRYPALMLTLERLDIDDVEVLTRLVMHASRVGAMSGDVARHEQVLALFQGPLALLVRAKEVRAISTDTVRNLVASFSLVAPVEAGYGRLVGRWIETDLLPAFGHDASIEGASPEATLLEALAGLRSTVESGGAALTWESSAYRVDLAAPELARLTEVRGRQEGNTLDTALAVIRTGASLTGGDPVAAARAAAVGLRALGEAVVPIQPSERTTASAVEDVPGLLTAIADDLGRLRSRGDQKRVAAVAERLARAEDALLADVLTSLLYSFWIGDPQGQAFLAGNVARRHDFGLRLMTGADRENTAWQLPLETSGSGEPWHLRGALLGLDVGLSRLALRRTRLDLPDMQPTLNESDRRTLVMTLALTSAFETDQASARLVTGWLREGRAIVADRDRLAARIDRLSLDGRRREAVRWASSHAPEELANLLLRTELVLLGRPDGTPVPAVWGQADTARSGCLCLAFPDPPAVDRVMGRPGTGLVTSRMADLKLRVLEVLDQLQLPAALARGVLASAMQDYLDEVRPVHGDDWLTLARQVDRVPLERFDDYVAALTAGGPLVPTAPAATSHNGQE